MSDPTVDALAAALHAVGVGCMQPTSLTRDLCVPSNPRYADFHPVTAEALAAALAERGLRLVRAEDDKALRELLREAIEVVHQTDSIRSHADPNDKTGWNVHGIETCEDLLCVSALAALESKP